MAMSKPRSRTARWQTYVSRCNTLPNYFPKWLYLYTFPPATRDSSSCSSHTNTCYSQFSKILANLITSLFFICTSLMTNDVKHLLMCFFTFSRKMYVQISCLYRFLARYKLSEEHYSLWLYLTSLLKCEDLLTTGLGRNQ